MGDHRRPRWASLQRSPEPLAGFKGLTSKGVKEAVMNERGKGTGRGRVGNGREWGKEREGKERGRAGRGHPLVLSYLPLDMK